MKICSYSTVGEDILRRDILLLFWLVILMSSRQLTCWMFANLNVSCLITKANNDKLNYSKFSFSKCEYCFVLTWGILFWNNLSKPRVMIRISEWTWFSCLLFLCSKYQWKKKKISWLCPVVWPLFKKKIKKHSLSFCPRVRYYFFFIFS